MRVVRPHPRFRLFLHADPSNGDVSRAMRNRCVELALLAPTTGEPTPRRPAGLGALTSSSSRTDTLHALAEAGVPGAALPRAMLAGHAAAARSAAEAHAPSPKLNALLDWARALLIACVHDSRGAASGADALATALARSAASVYPERAADAAVAAAAESLRASAGGPPDGEHETVAREARQEGQEGHVLAPASRWGGLELAIEGAAVAAAERDGRLVAYSGQSAESAASLALRTLTDCPTDDEEEDDDDGDHDGGDDGAPAPLDPSAARARVESGERLPHRLLRRTVIGANTDQSSDPAVDELAAAAGVTRAPPPPLAQLSLAGFVQRGLTSGAEARLARLALVRRVDRLRAPATVAAAPLEEWYEGLLRAVAASPAHAALLARQTELAARLGDARAVEADRGAWRRGVVLLNPSLYPSLAEAVKRRAAVVDAAAGSGDQCSQLWAEAARAARLLSETVTSRASQLDGERRQLIAGEPRPLPWLPFAALLHRNAGDLSAALAAARELGYEVTESVGPVPEVVHLLYPLMASIDAVANRAVAWLCGSGARVADDAPLLSLLRARDGLARGMLAPVQGEFPWARFLLHRRWLHKAFDRFARTVPSSNDPPVSGSLEAHVAHAGRVLARLEQVRGARARFGS